MTTTIQPQSLNNAVNASPRECCWMQGGVVDYKLCNLAYDCEHCPFDRALKSNVTRSRGDSLNCRTPEPWSQYLRHSEYTSAKNDGVTGSLFYHPSHTWVRIEDGGYMRVGLDQFAVGILGRPYQVTLPEPGIAVSYGEGCWHFTHQAGVSILVAPVSGQVKEINSALAQQPALLNRDPYGAGWTLLIEPTDLQGCLQRLLYGLKAVQWYEQEFVTLQDKVNEVTSRSGAAGRTMNDGGSLNRDFMRSLNCAQQRQVINSFFPLSLIERPETNNAILVKHGGESW